jgi:hypothetical protein
MERLAMKDSSYIPVETVTFIIPKSEDFLPAKVKYSLSLIIYSPPKNIKKRQN